MTFEMGTINTGDLHDEFKHHKWVPLFYIFFTERL